MVDRIIKVDDKFNPMPVADFYGSPPDDCRVVALSSRDVTVLRAGLLPFYWGTRFGEWLSPTRFRVVDNADLVELLEILEVKLMGCGIEQGLSAMAASQASIADAIVLLAKNQCCDTVNVAVEFNGGVNGSLEDGTVTYGTVPGISKPEEVPPGFTSEQSFDATICGRATAMVDGAIIGLGVWAGVETVGAIGVSVAFMLTVIGIITIPQVTIPTLIAFMAIGVLAAGSVYAVRLEVINHRQDLICLLYNGQNTGQISESLAELFDIIIGTAEVTGPVALAIKSVLMIFFSADTINKLYDDYAGRNEEVADCGDCGGEDCGDGGTVQRFVEFAPENVGGWSENGDTITFYGNVDTEDFGYYYSIWFGGTWQSPQYPSRRLVEVVSVSPTLTGDSEGGYFILLDNNGNVLPLANGIGTNGLAALNASLAESPLCIAIAGVSYAQSPVEVILRFTSE